MKSQFLLLIALITSFAMNTLPAQIIIDLWPAEVPNNTISDGEDRIEKTNIFWYREVIRPSIEVYLPTKGNANGQAMLICPGGGYTGLAYDWEGRDIAKFLNGKGIAAFVLKYRLPNSEVIETSHLAPIMDAQRALRILRSRAKEWNIQADQIGVIGFSAGGHLAATLGTYFTKETYSPIDAIDTMSARPDFMALIYPVITMNDSYTHQGSRNSLLGDNPDTDLQETYSLQQQVTKETPPTFLLHTGDDEGVPVENSLLFYQALRANNVPTEMHIYPTGGHGFSLAIGQKPLGEWPVQLVKWMDDLLD